MRKRSTDERDGPWLLTFPAGTSPCAPGNAGILLVRPRKWILLLSPSPTPPDTRICSRRPVHGHIGDVHHRSCDGQHWQGFHDLGQADLIHPARRYRLYDARLLVILSRSQTFVGASADHRIDRIQPAAGIPHDVVLKCRRLHVCDGSTAVALFAAFSSPLICPTPRGRLSFTVCRPSARPVSVCTIAALNSSTNVAVNVILAALSYLGAIGFIVFAGRVASADRQDVGLHSDPRRVTGHHRGVDQRRGHGPALRRGTFDSDAARSRPAVTAMFQVMTSGDDRRFQYRSHRSTVPGLLFLIVMLMVVGRILVGYGRWTEDHHPVSGLRRDSQAR